MRTWIVEVGEPLPIDEDDRPLRCGMLCERLVAAGHQVLWWASTFDHAHKRRRFDQSTTVTVTPGLTLRLLHGPGYRRNLSLRRLLNNRRVAAQFAREAAGRQAPPDLIFCSMPTPELAEKSIEFGRAQACYTKHAPYDGTGTIGRHFQPTSAGALDTLFRG